jgi:hypothetical protein
MVRRYARMSVKHLQPYADQLIFPASMPAPEERQETAKSAGHKNGHSRGKFALHLVSGN